MLLILHSYHLFQASTVMALTSFHALIIVILNVISTTKQISKLYT